MDLVTIEYPSPNVLYFQLLSLATSHLVGENKEFDVSVTFWGVSLIVYGRKLVTIKDLLLLLATSQSVDNNKEFDVSGIIWGVLLIVGGGNL